MVMGKHNLLTSAKPEFHVLKQNIRQTAGQNSRCFLLTRIKRTVPLILKNSGKGRSLTPGSFPMDFSLPVCLGVNDLTSSPSLVSANSPAPCKTDHDYRIST